MASMSNAPGADQGMVHCLRGLPTQTRRSRPPVTVADILAEVIGAAAAAGVITIVDAEAEEEAFMTIATVSASEAALTIVVAGAANERNAIEEIGILRTRTVCFIENPVMTVSCYRIELATSPCRGLNRSPANPQFRRQKTCPRLPSHHPPLRLGLSQVDSLQMPTFNH